MKDQIGDEAEGTIVLYKCLYVYMYVLYNIIL